MYTAGVLRKLSNILGVSLVIASIALPRVCEAASGCSGVRRPPLRSCAMIVCIPGDNTYEYLPLPQNTTCNNIGLCDGSDLDCIMPDTGSVFPAYYIASVIYAPPGSKSSVDYGTGSTIGTTTSTTQSWSNSLSVDVSNGADFLGIAAGDLTLSFGNKWSGSSVASIDVVEAVTSDHTVPGSPGDGIDHNSDQILLLLGPEVDVRAFPTQVYWSLNLSNTTPLIVLVGWLNGAAPMPSNVQQALGHFGITANDFPQILRVDPFANDPTGNTKPDPTRFVKVNFLPYESVLGQYTVKTNNSYTSSTTNTSDVSYTVGATVSVKVIGQKLKVADSFTFDNSSVSKLSPAPLIPRRSP
jgi:hypothetical protein